MHFRHIFPGQDKAVPSFGEAVEEWKPPDIYSRYNRHAINTILHYMLGLFFLYSLLPPLFLSSLFSFLQSAFFSHNFFKIFFYLFYFVFFCFFFHIFSHIFSLTKLKNAIHIVIQLIVQCGYIKPLKSMQLIRQFNNAIQLITQLSNTT